MTLEDNSNDKICIAFADDSTITQLLLKTLIAKDQRFHLILEADHGEMLLEKLRTAEKLPAVCILDLYMQPMNGIDTAYAIRKQYPEILLFGYSTSTEPKDIKNMLRAGVVAVSDKNAVNVSELLEKIYDYLSIPK
ncbi:response regulator [Sphingobacterium deserti]|uniref:Two component LuxR family transcriptional regulator n=1 Tax=Sphingobacterium deserti TaxID=1229276 RepID=A0A0B8T045_9SPHI|nr:response regulator [Sphingobacterium deserti]KGE13737.1 two component LuxR family transcriptional regulator [Sphingobacterium deserti]